MTRQSVIVTLLSGPNKVTTVRALLKKVEDGQVIFPVLELKLISTGAVDDGWAGKLPVNVRPLLAFAAGEQDDGRAGLVALIVGRLLFGSVRMEVGGGAVAEALRSNAFMCALPIYDGIKSLTSK